MVNEAIIINVVVGKNKIQFTFISLSYRKRGKVARIQINRVQIIMYIKVNLIVSSTGEINITTVNILIKRILEYSAKNSSMNDFLLNSMLNPEINSYSPSEKSNGVRFVSASVVIIQINIKFGTITTIGRYFCKFLIIFKFICSIKFIIVIRIIIKLIS